MIEVAKAIKDKYDKSAALQSLSSGGLWFGLAPQRTDTPFITFNIISDTPVYTSSDVIGDYVVQFSLFASDQEYVVVMFEELEKLFNLKELNTGDNDHVVCSRESSAGPVLVDETWMITADYQIMVRADRTAEAVN